MTKSEFKKEYFSIPNLLGYLRIVLAGLYFWMYLRAEMTADYYAAAAVLAVSMLSDGLDGRIARKFHQVTQWGKVLDPFADKLTLCVVLLGFVFRYPLMRTVLFVFLGKEAFMVLAGALLMSRGWRTDGATWYGKTATVGLYAVSLLLLLFPQMPGVAANVLMVLEIAVMLVALLSYMELYTLIAVRLFAPRQRRDGLSMKEQCGVYPTKPGRIGSPMEEIRERLKRFRKKRRIVLAVGAAVFLLYLIIGALAPFVRQPEISAETLASFDRERYYGTSAGVDRAALVETNEDALTQRLRMISMAKERIILSTFDFRSDESGKDMLAMLLAAADRGVQVEVFADGFNSWTEMEGNAYFYALSSHPNVTVRLYNVIRLLKPWSAMGRMHDKYVIVDDIAYLLGGRNTFGYFLGDYPGHKNYDRDVLVYNTAAGTGRSEESSLWELEAYYRAISELPVCSLFHDDPSIADWGCVKKARKELSERAERLWEARPELYPGSYDYVSHTAETNRIRLISNPTTRFAKEPTAYYEMMLLMQGAETSVRIHTPYVLCNDAMLEEFYKLPEQTSVMFNSAARNGNLFAAVDYLAHKQELIDTGVRILEYEGERSYHAKSVAIDDRLSLVGSFNMDVRSTYLDTELMLVIDSVELNACLQEAMEQYERYAAVVRDVETYEPLPEGMTRRELSWKKRVVYQLFGGLLKWIRFLL